MIKARLLASTLLALWLAAGAASASPPTFVSTVPYEPLVAKLKARGQAPSQILRLRSRRDLLRLDRDKRYKFVLEPHAAIAVAPIPADAPDNEYVHPILAAGHAVSTAGGITVEHGGAQITKVTLDQDSKAYCPTLQSLDEAARAIEKLGVPAQRILRQDRPPACAARMK